MSYHVHTSSGKCGDDFYGPYDSLADAAQAIARIATKAFHEADGILRTYTIVQADTAAEAEDVIVNQYGDN